MTSDDKKEGACCKPAAPQTCGCCCAASPKVKGTMRVISILVIVVIVALLYLQNKFAPAIPSAISTQVEKNQAPKLSHETRSFVRKDGKSFPLELDVAATKEQQTYGLMFRPSLAEGEGMMFTYEKPEMVSFWMKDTIISLDMFFVGSDGAILKIAKGAVPGDLTPIPSDVPVNKVIELKAGEADRMGLAVGDRLQ